MHIAVAVNENNLKAIIPETLEEAKGLLIIETDTMEVVDWITDKDWVTEMVNYDCEALICGDMYDPPLFEAIAAACISRYNGSNYSARKATRKMMDYELELIRDYVGGTGCGSHGHSSECISHHHDA